MDGGERGDFMPLVIQISDAECYATSLYAVNKGFCHDDEIYLEQSHARDLTELIISGDLDEMPFGMMERLEYLECSGIGLRRLDLSLYPRLSYLSCADNSLSQLDLSFCPSLEYLDCLNNQLTDLNPCTNLRELYFSGNPFTENRSRWLSNYFYSQTVQANEECAEGNQEEPGWVNLAFKEAAQLAKRHPDAMVIRGEGGGFAVKFLD